ncbi:sporulation membrane protein YtrI [Robertmurraya massiliosenegalensis]|uniref:sporulation membrane protein YtrI n=1 Tax=Robertmurraya TaxID=2837507 RepID=UPI0039A5BBE0
MKIPSSHQFQEWRRLFAGMAIGALISWLIFLFIFGDWMEDYSMEIKLQEEEIKKLQGEKKIWQEDVEKINKENEEKLTIQTIEVKILNHERYKLDLFSVHEIEESAKEDIRTLLTQNIETAFKSRDLIRRAIENRTFKAHEKRYRLKIKEIVFYTTLTIQVELQFDE